jgi:hypothetical protein
MGKINMSRVILGGLLSGLVISIGEILLNGLILGKEWEEAMRALNRPPLGVDVTIFFTVLCFALGILAVWTYAAMRSRFGPGPRTAITAGLLVWGLAYLYPSASGLPMQIIPRNLIFIGMLWGLFEVPIATVAGAWLYKEEQTPV